MRLPSSFLWLPKPDVLGRRILGAALIGAIVWVASGMEVRKLWADITGKPTATVGSTR